MLEWLFVYVIENGDIRIFFSFSLVGSLIYVTKPSL